MCPNRTSFVFALVVSKRQATLGLQAIKTPPDLSKFALSVSCRPADLLIKEAKNGQDCSDAGKKALRAHQTGNLVGRTLYTWQRAGAMEAQRPKALMTGRNQGSSGG